jgi:asparagine synthase (glutamine-hydrolysing)
MCGIVGLYVRQGRCDTGVVLAMRDSLIHRGPDEAGHYVADAIGLGHRRLSIIDLGSGQQPMSTEDGRWVLSYNGEIYNYRELRADLEASGVHFKTNSDTEVILRLHVRDGDAAVARLNGIFAYSLWDSRTRRLLLVRDRAGIKPLYYCAADQGFAFASEIKALFKSGLCTPRLNRAALAEYLTFNQVAGAAGLFSGVVSLPPGHIMEVVDGRAGEPRRYWSTLDTITPFGGTYPEAVDRLDAELNAAIKSQMMSDVPLGTFCSGGIDSSLVTAIAARHSRQPINTFSVGFEEKSYDESAYARQVSAACATTHHELKVSEAEYARTLPKMVWHLDQPLNFANSVHIFAVSELAKKHVTVVLTGEGADELLGGYPRYYIPRLLAPLYALPAPLRRAIAAVSGLSSDHRFRKLRYFAGRSAEETIVLNCANVEVDAVQGVLPGGAPPDLSERRRLLAAARAQGYEPIDSLMLLDFQTYLVSILERQDKMSMAASVEARVPFLDNAIIDFAHSLPLGFKQTAKQRKRVLQDVALRYLPAEVVHRPKSGFGVPLPNWFAGNGPMAGLLAEAVASREISELFEPRALATLLQEQRGGRDHSTLLWGVLNLYLWRTAFNAS